MFKNLQVMEITPISQTTTLADELLSSVHANEFKSTTATQQLSLGWVAVVDDDLTYCIVDDVIRLTMRKEQRNVPASVVAEYLKAKVIEHEQLLGGKKLSNKRKTELRNEIIFGLLPRVLPTSSYTNGYIDLVTMQIVVDTTSKSVAEEFVSLLRKSMPDGLSTSHFTVADVNVPAVLTKWLTDESLLPVGLGYGEDCKLVGELKESLTFKNFSINQPEVKLHLANAMNVSSIGLCYNSQILFTLDVDLGFKRLLQLTGVDVQESSGNEPELTEYDLFYVDFVLTVSVNRELISAISAFISA